MQDTSGGQTPLVKEVKLPIALEKVLAFKDVRVSQVGMKPEDLERVERGNSSKHLFIAFYCMHDAGLV